MSAGDPPLPTIPGVFIGQSDGDALERAEGGHRIAGHEHLRVGLVAEHSVEDLDAAPPPARFDADP